MKPTPLLLTLLALSLAGCTFDTNSARGVADRFIDQHYVQINLEGTKALCSGPALHKVQKEQELTQGQLIDDTTRKPQVKYRLVDEHNGDGTTVFVFEGVIQVEDAGQFQRKWIVTTRQVDKVWKVSNFEETE